MKQGTLKGKGSGTGHGFLKDSEYLTNLLVALLEKKDTPALISYLADEPARLLLCKALVSPVSGSDRQLAQRANQILRNRGLDPEPLKKRLEPAAVALGLVSTCDIQIDYYDVLGVKPSATSSELRAAYRKKAFEIHPDTAGETPEDLTDFVILKAAYDTLMEPGSRAAFDQYQAHLGSWYEEGPKESPGDREKRRSSGRLRKASYRVAAVVAVMVAIAWVLSIMYEGEAMLELVQVTPSTELRPAREMVEPAAVDIREVEKKAPVPEPVEAREPIKVQAKPPPEPTEQGPTQETKPVLDVKTEDKGVSEKPKAVPAPEPVEVTALSSVKPEKKQAPVVPESLKEKPKEVLKPAPAKKKVVKETPVVAKKKQPKAPTPVRPKLPEKPAEPSIQQASAAPPPSGRKPWTTPSLTDKVKTKKPETDVSKAVGAQATAFSVDPPPPKSSLHVSRVSPLPAFPDIPIPKTHKTPSIERSQVLAFLKKYTTAYERGNAETFFSYFTVNALENGEPLMTFKPDYLEIWDKVQSLNYRIVVNELNQFVGSDTVSMKGRFDLDWEFRNGRSGQSRGDISMDLTLGKSDLLISSLNYRFD